MRRYIDTFESFSINENYTQALKYIETLPDKDSDYLDQLQTLKTMLVKYPNWILPFSKFRFKDGISYASLDKLIGDLVDKKSLLNMLPKPVVKYNSYEEIIDGVIQIERYQAAKKIIDKIPNSQLRQQLLTPAYIERMKNVSDLFDKMPADFLQNNFFNKASAYKTPEDVLAALEQLVTKSSVNDVIKKAKEAGAEVVYADQTQQIIIVRVSTYKSCKKIGPKAWCIVREEESFNDYVGPLDFQYIIYNLKLSSANIKSIIGITINSKGECTAAHLRNDEETNIEQVQEELPNIPWSSILKPMTQDAIDKKLMSLEQKSDLSYDISKYGSYDLINHYAIEYYKKHPRWPKMSMFKFLHILSFDGRQENMIYLLDHLNITDSRDMTLFISLFVSNYGHLTQKMNQVLTFLIKKNIDFNQMIIASAHDRACMVFLICEYLSDGEYTKDLLDLLYNKLGFKSKRLWLEVYSKIKNDDKVFTILRDFIH